jgi:hypothetical protein
MTPEDMLVGKTCPYCQFPLQMVDDVSVCDQCGIPHHVECWEQNGRCTTFGCTGGPRPGVARAPSDGAVIDFPEEPIEIVCPSPSVR